MKEIRRVRIYSPSCTSVPLTLRALQEPAEGEIADGEIDRIQSERPPQLIHVEHAVQQDRAHALEHMGRRQSERNRLEPVRQHRHRVIDARERQQDEGKRPGKLLGAEPVAQDHAGREKSERPARQHEQREEGDERKPEIEQVEAEEEIGGDRDRDHADGKPQHAPHAQGGDELEGSKRAREQIAEIARPHLLDEGGGEADLGAEQNVPQQHRADQHAGGLRERARGAGEIFLEKAPGEHLEEGPVDQLEQPDAGTPQQIHVAEHQRADAAERSAEAGRRQEHGDGAGS